MEDNSQIFHDRAYNATLEIRKILMSLSTGILAVYFFSLTQEIKPPLNIAEKIILTINIILFSFSILFGLLAWFSDNKRFFYKAKELDNLNEKEKYTKAKDRWYRMRRLSDILFYFPFAAGIIFSAIFLILRII
ncbi:MAG TPA: hypothetical protein DCZ94_21055 [Lentisphaeria bacterium]|nr:MAG: hypothetical protein A2X48_23260 [Lentisphaerae bacterium GWF2_49_21]HBC89434.1 hypothetical protein [Lentisphaeria bacterium]